MSGFLGRRSAQREGGGRTWRTSWLLSATSPPDEEILAARRVMRQLRPQIAEEAYLSTVRRMMQTDGYLQAAVFEGDSVVAVAGYRFMEMLFSGKSLYGRSQHRRDAAHAVTASC